MNCTQLRLFIWGGLALITTITLWLVLPKPDIWESVKRGNEFEVRLLLTFGADPNTRDEIYETTLLMTAASQGHLSVARTLIEHGADVNAERRLYAEPAFPLHYRTALFDAVRDADSEMVGFLLENGANPNVQDFVGYTPLSYAASTSDIEKVRLLLDHGAEINAHNCTNANPLSLAGNVEAARLLLERGADLEIRGNDTHASPLLWHISCGGELAITKLLVERGGNVNAQGMGGRTPLMQAAQYGLNDTVRLLLQHGADINARDRRDNSALSLALEWHQPSTVALLKAAGAKQRIPKRRKIARRLSNQKVYAVIQNREYREGANSISSPPTPTSEAR